MKPLTVLGLAGGIDPEYSCEFEFPSGFAHDTAAVLVRDGEVVAGIEEERLNRIKHCNKLWEKSARFCLDEAGISWEELDYVAIYATELWTTGFLRKINLVTPGLLETTSAREHTGQLLDRVFDCSFPREKIRFVHHHDAHAASTYYMSGFNDALILTIDGIGDNVSGRVYDGRSGEMNVLRTLDGHQSLGEFYREAIRLVGYYMFDEYKVMGLAPYGKPEVFREQFQQVYRLLPEGQYEVNPGAFLGFYDVMSPRKKGEEFGQKYCDFSAALQEALEDIVFHVLEHFQEKTGHEYLCLAGGVAQNSSMNGSLQESGIFKDVFAHPASHDAGCALGSALVVNREIHPDMPRRRMQHVYWGKPTPPNDAIEEVLSSWKDWVSFRKVDAVEAETAELLASGSAIGWVQGRSEFGPRALGCRSILADPRPAKNKDRINAMIKKREGYRPFAPSILAERVSDYFELQGEQEAFPFMAFVLEVREDKRELLGATTHVDGTARLQTVHQETNPRYWELIHEFEKRTGVPILLNTSFNNNAEPIVDSVEDAIVCYLTSGLDQLVVGDFIIEKHEGNLERLKSMHLEIPYIFVMEEQHRASSYGERETMHSIFPNADASRRTSLSAGLYDRLTRVGKGCLVKELGEWNDALLGELYDLWDGRIVRLTPGP